MLPTGILIAVPAYGGSIKTPCVHSVFSLLPPFNKLGITAELKTSENGDIAAARNLFCSALLASAHSHILFVDNDMEFRHETVMKMIAAEKPVIGCVYPKRTIAPEFAIWHNKETTIQVENGAADVRGIGMGLCLIAKAALEELIPSVRKTMVFSRPVYGFFDPIQIGSDFQPEDLSFCMRWTKHGGKVRALLSEDIGHIGDYAYRGSYLDSMHVKPSQSRVRPETR